MLNRLSRLDVFLAMTLLMSSQAFRIAFLPTWGLTALALGLTVMRWQLYRPVDVFLYARHTLNLLLRGGFSGALIGMAASFWSESLPVLQVLAGILAVLAIGLFLSSAHSISRTVNANWCAPQPA